MRGPPPSQPSPSRGKGRDRTGDHHRSPDPTSSVLLEIYHRLFKEYGPQHWWPAETPLEVILGAILTQSVAWTGVERALNNLKEAGYVSIQALQDIPEDELATLLRPSGYFNAKAKKVKAFIQHLWDNYDGNLGSMLSREITDLRPELLSIHGIGEETADDIVLYAAGQPSFVIDSYTRRVISRLGMAPSKESYGSYQSVFHEGLPSEPDLFNEYHALLDEHAKVTCRKQPLCAACCLRDMCSTGSAPPSLRQAQDRL